MGNETDNIHQAITEKATLDKKVSNMKIGVCEMQGWRNMKKILLYLES